MLRSRAKSDRLAFGFHVRYHAGVDVIQRPIEALAILHPLKIGDSDPASIGENVGQNDHIFAGQDRICLWRDWPVCELDDHPGTYVVRIALMDQIFHRGRSNAKVASPVSGIEEAGTIDGDFARRWKKSQRRWLDAAGRWARHPSATGRCAAEA